MSDRELRRKAFELRGAIRLIVATTDYTNMKVNLSRFDFGICMAAFDGKKTIRTKEFDSDAETRAFTLHRADNESQFAYSMSRYEKITAGRYSAGP